jgi:hypothetical protein
MAYTQAQADAAYAKAVGAGFAAPTITGPSTGAVEAAAILLAHPATDVRALKTEWDGNHDGNRLLAAHGVGQKSTETDAAINAYLRTQDPNAVLGVAGDFTGGLAKGIGEGVTAAGAVIQAGEQAAAQTAQQALGPFAFLAQLTNPQFLLRVLTAIGGGVLVLMGAWLMVENTGTGRAVTRAVGKVAL